MYDWYVAYLFTLVRFANNAARDTTSRGGWASERNFTPRRIWNFHTEEDAENCWRIPACKRQCEGGYCCAVLPTDQPTNQPTNTQTDMVENINDDSFTLPHQWTCFFLLYYFQSGVNHPFMEIWKKMWCVLCCLSSLGPEENGKWSGCLGDGSANNNTTWKHLVWVEPSWKVVCFHFKVSVHPNYKNTYFLTHCASWGIHPCRSCSFDMSARVSSVPNQLEWRRREFCLWCSQYFFSTKHGCFKGTFSLPEGSSSEKCWQDVVRSTRMVFNIQTITLNWDDWDT